MEILNEGLKKFNDFYKPRKYLYSGIKFNTKERINTYCLHKFSHAFHKPGYQYSGEGDF